MYRHPYSVCLHLEWRYIFSVLCSVCLHLQMGEPPDSMTWCGEDAVLAHWAASGSLLLVGPGDSATFPSYEEDSAGVPLVLTPEVDGARVVSRRASAFVQRVPDPVVATFGIGSTDPAALLYDAFEQFDKRSVKVRPGSWMGKTIGSIVG